MFKIATNHKALLSISASIFLITASLFLFDSFKTALAQSNYTLSCVPIPQNVKGGFVRIQSGSGPVSCWQVWGDGDCTQFDKTWGIAGVCKTGNIWPTVTSSTVSNQLGQFLCLDNSITIK